MLYFDNYIYIFGAGTLEYSNSTSLSNAFKYNLIGKKLEKIANFPKQVLKATIINFSNYILLAQMSEYN